MAAPMDCVVGHNESSCGKREDFLPHGDRTFYKIPKKSKEQFLSIRNGVNIGEKANFRSYIDNNIIGRDSTFHGPYGQRKVVYCDYTASGRSLDMIEDYIRRQVLPLYGNTHTTTTVTSLQTTLYRHEARDIIRNAVNASEHDAVIFVGTGCTAGIHKLIHSMNLQAPPVVFVGPFEHHSNLLPWRETGAEVVRISETEDGLVDLNCLEAEMKKRHTSGRQLIGCFSAASNVTGILTDDIQVTVLLHRYKALAFWDYATAGPYVDINMNPVTTDGDIHSLAYKDAVFLSPHKFVGGVETPGILIAKKSLFRNPVPSNGGGGSVFFVSHEDHRYLKQVEMREEGGTPSIVGAIRAGLVFQLKAAMGADNIMAREHELCRRALSRWSSCSSLVLLGSTEVPRLPIFSFLIRHPTTRQFLHHNFVCAVLNDVFGIQARGGCACAGPYAQDLLGIDKKLAKEIEAVLLEDSRLDRVHLRRYTEYSEREILRPGFTRLNLPYFMDDECVEFVLEALSLTAQHAWKLLPQYIFNPETGEWKQRNHQVFQDRRWLGSISYSEGKMTYPDPPALKSKGKLPADYKDCLQLAEEIFKKAEKARVQLPDQTLLFDSKAADLRWFMLPSEALGLLSSKAQSSQHALPHKLPFEPITYKPKMERSDTSDVDWELNQGVGSLVIGSMEGYQRTAQAPDCFTLNTARIGSDNRVAMETMPCDTHHEMSCAELFQNTVEDGFMAQACNKQEAEQAECTDYSDWFSQTEFKGRTEHEGSDSVDPEKNPNSETDILENVKGNELSSDSALTVCGNVGVVGDRTTCDDANCVLWNSEDFHMCKDAGSCKAKSNTTDTGLLSFSSANSSPVSVKGKSSDTLPGVLAEQISDDAPTQDSSAQELEPAFSEPEPEGEVSHVGSSSISSEPETALTGKSDEQSSDDFQDKQATNDLKSTDQKCKITQGQPSPLPDVESQNSSSLETANSGGEKPKNKRSDALGFKKPPKSIFKPTVQALEEYKMIQDGDRVLVCLSGGKDSLSLLHTLKQYQFYAKSKGISFELGGVTVDPQTLAYDPRPLIPYLASLGVPYFYEEQCIIETAAGLQGGCDSICSFCSRMKRGRLYACARREGYNVLAMGQHLDDLAESFLMSVFHNGLLRTMKANYTVKEGDLRVIRPLVYTREKDLRDFAEKAKLPVIPENCPACFEAPKERHRTKQLLASQELLFPRLYNSLQAAMKPLMAKNKTGMESSRKKEDFFEENDL